MRRAAGVLCLLAWMAVGLLPAAASTPRDPLTEEETDQLREAAQDPPLKLKLFLKFAQERLASAEALRFDPKAGPDRGRQIHDLLEDFGNLVDEIGNNLDAYAARKEDLRKPLAEVIAAANDFSARLREFKAAAAASPAAAKQARDYSFALEDAADSVTAGLQNAEELLAEQKELFKKQEKK